VTAQLALTGLTGNDCDRRWTSRVVWLPRKDASPHTICSHPPDAKSFRQYRHGTMGPSRLRRHLRPCSSSRHSPVTGQLTLSTATLGTLFCLSLTFVTHCTSHPSSRRDTPFSCFVGSAPRRHLDPAWPGFHGQCGRRNGFIPVASSPSTLVYMTRVCLAHMEKPRCKTARRLSPPCGRSSTSLVGYRAYPHTGSQEGWVAETR
jgi:hypothetical protein